MVVGQCHNQQHNGILVDGGRLSFCSTRDLSHSKGFSLSRLHMPAAATRFVSSLSAASSASPAPQKQLSSPSEPSSTIKLPSRSRTFLESTVDKDGYLCSPRAARELAFSILYSALLLDKKPIRVFRDRLKQQSGYISKDLLASYKHVPDDGDSLIVDDASSAKKLKEEQLEESLIEAAVLSAPPIKVYNRSNLSFAQEIIEHTEDCWSEHDIILSDLLPDSWKKQPSSAAAQICILHMSMAEMTRCGTSFKIVISEAVDLAKRFLDMRSAQIINGCLGKFVRSEYYKQSQMQ